MSTLGDIQSAKTPRTYNLRTQGMLHVHSDSDQICSIIADENEKTDVGDHWLKGQGWGCDLRQSELAANHEHLHVNLNG